MLASALSKEASAAVQDALALAQAIVDTVPGPLVVLEQDLRVVAASRSFYQIFGLVPDEIQGRFLYEIGDGQWRYVGRSGHLVDLPSCWLRFEIERRSVAHLRLVFHHRTQRFEVGHCLNLDERREIAPILARALAASNKR